MSIRLIASVVVAALLMTGGAVTAGQITEYGVHPAKEQEALTKEEAKEIALEHAALTEAEVTGLRVEYDVERGTQEWEVDFRSGDWEYDYEINAETGAVIKSKKEYDPPKAAKLQKPAETQPQATEPPRAETTGEKKLTADEAKAIALNHAGLQENQVKGLRAEYDGDDRVPEWDIEFYADGMEYDYEIHAETGEIRSWDKERDN